MGWKGVVRSIGAASRAAERDAKRRNRQLELQAKQYARMEALEQAAYEYDVYCNHIDLIKSVHKDCGDGIDWLATSKLVDPEPPILSRLYEVNAKKNLDSYKPSLADQVLRRVEKVRKRLERELLEARALDVSEYNERKFEWEEKLKEHQRNRSIAEKIFAGLAEPRINVLRELNPFSEIVALGSSLEFSANDGKPMSVRLKVHGKDVLPKEKRVLLQSGKLSRKAFPIGEFNELHQDYVCSCVLRVAREIFSLLPDDIVIVTALDKTLDKTTGHLIELPILSVAISRSTLASLNLDLIDPSESMHNFIHNMSFKKTIGFSPVDKLDEFSFNLDCSA